MIILREIPGELMTRRGAARMHIRSWCLSVLPATAQALELNGKNAKAQAATGAEAVDNEEYEAVNQLINEDRKSVV